MKHKNLWLLAAILAVFCYACVMRCNESGKDNPAALVQPDDDSRFVTLTDAVPDAILEIRYYGTYNFVGNRVDGYEQPVALLTKEAAKALRAVSDDVKKQGYRLKIYDAYRPQKGVDHFVRWAADTSDTKMKPYLVLPSTLPYSIWLQKRNSTWVELSTGLVLKVIPTSAAILKPANIPATIIRVPTVAASQPNSSRTA